MFKKILLQSIQSKCLKWFIPTSFCGCAGFFLLGKNFWDLCIWDSVLLGIFIIIGIFILIFLWYGAKEFGKYIHNIYVDSIWGYAIIELKNAYSEIHFLRKQDNISPEEFISVMINFCNILKKIFDKKTNANCCVSIKVPISNGENLEALELSNLCRDSDHQNRDTDQYKKIKHRIIGNTAFSKIVNKILKGNQKHLAYVNNDISKSLDYENTSIECYIDKILPYNSELVYPIVPIKGNELYQNNLKGFICIDCNKPNKFDENRYDIPMVEGVADGIYDIFEKYENSIKRNR